MIICKGNSPIHHLRFREFKQTWREILYVVKEIVAYDDLLVPIIVKIHCEEDVRDTRLRIHKFIITNVDSGERRNRTLKCNMLYIYRYTTSINPTDIIKSVVCYCYVAVILSVYHSGIASYIEACKNIIMPYLIISHEASSIELTLL